MQGKTRQIQTVRRYVYPRETIVDQCFNKKCGGKIIKLTHHFQSSGDNLLCYQCEKCWRVYTPNLKTLVSDYILSRLELPPGNYIAYSVYTPRKGDKIEDGYFYSAFELGTSTTIIQKSRVRKDRGPGMRVKPR